MVTKGSKTLLRNIIRHTDTHNRLLEQSDMWRQRETSSVRHSGRSSPRSSCRSQPRAHMDRADELVAVSYPASQREEEPRGTYWSRQLQTAEEQDSNRWGHGGYKEMYPEEFHSSRSRSSSSEAAPRHHRKHAKKEKKKKKKKKHRHKHKSEDTDQSDHGGPEQKNGGVHERLGVDRRDVHDRLGVDRTLHPGSHHHDNRRTNTREADDKDMRSSKRTHSEANISSESQRHRKHSRHRKHARREYAGSDSDQTESKSSARKKSSGSWKRGRSSRQGGRSSSSSDS